MPSGLMKHIAWDPLVGAIVSNALPKATSKAAMLSLYSAVSGFATTPSHGAVEMCFCGNYPLTMAPTSGSHAMWFISPDGGNTAYMGNAGTHPVEGDAASLVCPPEYHDQSAADGVDCFTVPFHAGECEGAEDHGTHDHGNGTDPHPTSPPCDSLAACNGNNPGTVGVSAACYQAVGGIIQAGQAPASWTACNDAQQATVSTACQEAVGSFAKSVGCQKSP